MYSLLNTNLLTPKSIMPFNYNFICHSCLFGGGGGQVLSPGVKCLLYVADLSLAPNAKAFPSFNNGQLDLKF
jgi:hypothetical protein